LETEREYIIRTFEENYKKYKDKNIFIYGVGYNTKTIVEHFTDYNILGVLDGTRHDEYIYGKYIYNLPDIVALNPDVIVIIARKTNVKFITRRISKFCIDNNIKLADEFVNNLLVEKSNKKEKEYFNLNESSLKDEIEKHDVISFDIFDTLIMRRVLLPQDVFDIVANTSNLPFNFKKESFKIEKSYSKTILSLGTPMAIQSGFINISMLFVNSLINGVGVVASATFGVGCRIDDIVNKICMGIQYAAIPMISQNIGAGRGDRAKKIVHWAWIYSSALTVFFLILYIFFGGWLFRIFSDDPRVHEMSSTFIIAILWMFPAFAVMRGSGAFIQGIGYAKLSMVLALLDGVLLRIGLSWLFGIAFKWGFFGFVLGYALAPYGYAIPSMIYFLSGRWKQRQTLAEKL